LLEGLSVFIGWEVKSGSALEKSISRSLEKDAWYLSNSNTLKGLDKFRFTGVFS